MRLWTKYHLYITHQYNLAPISKSQRENRKNEGGVDKIQKRQRNDERSRYVPCDQLMTEHCIVHDVFHLPPSLWII